MKIVLASSSPRRKKLLEQINLVFTVDPSDLSEKIEADLPPSEIVMVLASRKGKDIADKHPNALVIAADTIVTLNNTILGKPASKKEAEEMLSLLSGATHSVFTGVWAGISDSSSISKDILFYKRTFVTFNTLSQEEIHNYVSTGNPFDKAGAYGIQDDTGCLFVKSIRGDYNNVVGFPLSEFYQQLKIYMPDIHNQIFLNRYS